jgi:hypothetical protein
MVDAAPPLYSALLTDLLSPRQPDRTRFGDVHDPCTHNYTRKHSRDLVVNVGEHLRVHGSCE